MNENEFKNIEIDDTKYKTLLTKNFIRRKPYTPKDPTLLIAFIPGTIREIYVSAGDFIKKDQDLLILEAMKMKNLIKSQFDVRIKSVNIKVGDTVMKNQTLIEFDF
jgi:biotin carboxyl carrier protein